MTPCKIIQLAAIFMKKLQRGVSPDNVERLKGLLVLIRLEEASASWCIDDQGEYIYVGTSTALSDKLQKRLDTALSTSQSEI